MAKLRDITESAEFRSGYGTLHGTIEEAKEWLDEHKFGCVAVWMGTGIVRVRFNGIWYKTRREQ